MYFPNRSMPFPETATGNRPVEQTSVAGPKEVMVAVDLYEVAMGGPSWLHALVAARAPTRIEISSRIRNIIPPGLSGLHVFCAAASSAIQGITLLRQISC